MPSGAMLAAAHPPAAGRLMIVLEPLSHPDLAPIRIHDNLFAIGRTEAPFDRYPQALAADLSRRHARLFCEQGAVYLAELGSKNGSSVNGAAVGQAITMLRDGDVLGLGKNLTYRVHLEPAALQAPQARLSSLTLTPEHEGTGLQPIVVSEFPFLVSKADDAFARYRDSDPTQLNYLSRRHAHLFLKAGRLHVEDLGSTNGTFVNGIRLDEHAVALHEGDVLAFGGRHFVYRLSMAWDAAAQDPTLTRIGAASAPAAAGLDADRTTFVATADSFLDIFCVEAGAGVQEAAAAPTAAAATPPAPVKSRRLRYGGLAALALAGIAALALHGIGNPERQVEDLLASGAWPQAAARAQAALALDPGNARLQALALEAQLKAALPAWMAALKAGQYRRAAVQLSALRAQAGNNPELAPLLDELEWIVALQAFVAARGGAQAPLRGPADAAAVQRFLRQWDERGEAYQRGFVTMAAHVPAFRDTYADALSNVRGLALARRPE